MRVTKAVVKHVLKAVCYLQMTLSGPEYSSHF